MSDDHSVYFDSAHQLLESAVAAVESSRHQLRIWTESVDNAMYESEQLLGALKAFCHNRSDASVQFLVPAKTVSLRSHPTLLALVQRMPSQLQLRESADAVRECKGRFIVGDRSTVMQQPDIETLHGYYNPNYKVRASQLIDTFDRVWQYATVNPEFRALTL